MLAVIVAFSVGWNLRLPGITMAGEPICGLEAHEHGEGCYSAGGEQVLACAVSGTVVHTHDSMCYDADGALRCKLEEAEEHTHADACYQPGAEVVLDPGHTHTDVCYAPAAAAEPVRELTCALTEGPAVTAPGEPVLSCTLAETAGHAHGEGCYSLDETTGEQVLTCAEAESEGHAHGEGCYTPGAEVVVDPGHTHTEGCYTIVQPQTESQPLELICGLTEGSAVTEPGAPELVCGKEVLKLHTHEDVCYVTDGTSGEKTLVCTEPEVIAHQHGEGCFAAAEPVLTCILPIHIHTEDCYAEIPEDRVPLTDEEKAQVAQVVAMIDLLPEPGEFETVLAIQPDEMARRDFLNALSEQLAETRTAYDALQDKLRSAVTNLARLEAAEQAHRKALAETPLTDDEQKQVASVMDSIEKLPDRATMEGNLAAYDASGDIASRNQYLELVNQQLRKVRTDYDALTEHQKLSVTNLDKLTAAEADYLDLMSQQTLSRQEQLQVDAVVALIAELPDPAKVEATMAQFEAEGDAAGKAMYLEMIGILYSKAQASYDALNEWQRSAVTNAEVLDAYELVLAGYALPIAGSEFSAALSDGSVTATVITEGEMPAGTSFVITPIAAAPAGPFVVQTTSQSGELADIRSKVEAFLSDMNGELLEMVPLDMHFTDITGNEIAAAGRTEVTLNFEKPILAGEGAIFALHITPAGAEDVTRDIVRDERGVSSITLVTDSFSAIVVTRATATTDTLTVKQINQYTSAVTTLVWNPSDTTIRAKLGNGVDFANWNYIRVEQDGEYLIVKEIRTDAVGKLDMAVPGRGFVLLTNGITVDAQVGDRAIPEGNFYSASATAYDSGGLGNVIFANLRDNSNKLTEITDYADTREFIDVNLYDYKVGINDKYRTSKAYPGFQQDGGTTGTLALSQYRVNFGNNITTDLDDKITNVTTNSPGLINKTVGGANEPLTGAIKDTLGADGYPVLTENNASLKYLFTTGGPVTKMNTANIEHLFRKIDGENGEYSYNSRLNHAQFNASTNSFTQYHQMITSNYMMYPFGNFLPFNDIVKKAHQASLINADYISQVAASASTKSGTGYADLNTALKNFNTRFAALEGNNWKAEDATNYYFSKSGIPKVMTNAELEPFYNIDYDEPTNFFFGMTMEMDLMQPKDGFTGDDGTDVMHFYFAGDDDVWVFVDGKLFLDLSGIHRHVGGAIDFEHGVVMRFALSKATGDVGTTLEEALDVKNFEDILGTDSPLLERVGGLIRRHDGSTVYRFKDYSVHKFKFYYMERGAGSSVCRMNFNFPLLQHNSIRVTKQVTEETGRLQELLGDPDYKFQVLKEGSEELFIHANRPYNILDSGLIKIGTGVTDENGVFTLKAGQTAEFTDIAENSGRYYVRELLEPEVYAQYGYRILVDGSAVTQDSSTEVEIDHVKFQGVNSPVKDISDGSTTFTYDNSIIFDQLGSLKIGKVVDALGAVDPDKTFSFQVTFDGEPIPVGTPYTVGSSRRTVTNAGLIHLKAGEEALIEKIIAGAHFTVQETAQSSAGYKVDYGSAPINERGEAYGVIAADQTVSITVTNAERGAKVSIPLVKLLTNPDGAAHTFTFTLRQIADPLTGEPVSGGAVITKQITFPAGSTSHRLQTVFDLVYLEANAQPGIYYYSITEDAPAEADVTHDQTGYVVQITVESTEAAMTAAVTGWWKNLEKVEDLSSFAVSFENTLLSDLSLTKKISGAVNPDAQFTFLITLLHGDVPVSGTFATVNGETAGTVTFDEAGQATVTLGAEQTLVIQGLPYGDNWTIEEQNTNGYKVSYSINGADVVLGDSAGGTVTKPGGQVTFTNDASTSLPKTGGSALFTYAFGVLLTAAPLGYAASQRKRGRRGSGK